MNELIEIRKVSPIDLYTLQKISRDTFSETFAAVNTTENMAKYLEVDLSIERLSSELNTENSDFYFALSNNRVIGYLKLNFGQSQTDIKDYNAVEIERIYTLKEFHGKKVGQILLDKALLVAREMKAIYVWLGVWEENHRAISFYRKNGFVEFSKHIFMLGDDQQTDIMMKKVL